MAVAWRLVRLRHAATAFDGEGAFRFGGRWNSPRTRIVYTSTTLSLAALETLVHLTPPMPLRYLAYRLQFDDVLVAKLPPRRLPRDWKVQPPGHGTMSIGDEWVRRGRTAILAVPSVLVPGELNYLLNPGHPDFKKVSIGRPQPFSLDSRLIR
jgi:RES domain-containing protein